MLFVSIFDQSSFGLNLGIGKHSLQKSSYSDLILMFYGSAKSDDFLYPYFVGLPANRSFSEEILKVASPNYIKEEILAEEIICKLADSLISEKFGEYLFWRTTHF